MSQSSSSSTPNTVSLRRILIVEDDLKLSRLLVDYFVRDGFLVTTLYEGQTVLPTINQAQVDKQPFSALILDLSLPNMDGIEACRQVRQRNDVPILMLTARADEVSRLLGFDTGADDYVTKPFQPREVVARIGALIRRAEGRVTTESTQPQLWKIDEASIRIAWRDEWLTLTPIEFRILRCLLMHPNRVFTRAQLLDAGHLDLRDVNDRAIDTHIKNIRKKMQQVDMQQPLIDEVAQQTDTIATIYGVGYRFNY